MIFTGIARGVYRTDLALRERAENDHAIPSDVERSEGFNHIGDPSFDPAGGGRILLPLECYGGSEHCRRAALGVVDKSTLKWRYHVRTDAASKLMWVEVSPDGRLAWSSSGGDLIAFAAEQISAKSAAAGVALRPVRRLSGVLRMLPGVTGAAFWRGRLMLAGQRGSSFEVNSLSLIDGSVRLEIERKMTGESEGLDSVSFSGGVLQWQIMPRPWPFPPSYLRPTLLSFAPR